MKFIISDEIFKKYPDAVIGVVVAKNVDNKNNDENIARLLRNEEENIRKDFSLESLAQHPFVQNWRKAYKAFRSEDRCSSESLIRRVLKGNEIPPINKLVDLYNYISLKYRTPIGGEDLDKIEGDIYLKLSDGSEKFILLGGSSEEIPEKGEVVYSDSNQVLCRKWNWRESENTKLTESTQNVFLAADALPPVDENAVRNALEELSYMIKNYLGGETQTFIMDSEKRGIEF